MTDKPHAADGIVRRTLLKDGAITMGALGMMTSASASDQAGVEGTPGEQGNKTIVRRASFDVYNEGTLEVLDEQVSDDVVLYDISGSRVIRGREAYEEYVRGFGDAFPDFSVTIDSIIGEGNLVAVRYTASGTFEGRLPGRPGLEPTGQEFEVIGMEFDRIEDGRLAERKGAKPRP